MSALKYSDAEKFYITGKSQGENTTQVSEILTLFYHEVDAEYYQGKSCPEGLLPYEQRYTYGDMEYLTIDPEEDAAYVAAASELNCFDLELYDVSQYGTYYLLERKD